MTKHSSGPAIDQSGASTPAKEERDREFAGITGDSGEEGGKASPGDRDRGETSSAESDPPLGIGSAHDRAS